MTSTCRPIVATIYHRKRALKARHYARVSTAFPRALTWLILNGQPGDVVEFAHASLGFQIGTVKIHAGGRITVSIVKENQDD